MYLELSDAQFLHLLEIRFIEPWAWHDNLLCSSTLDLLFEASLSTRGSMS